MTKYNNTHIQMGRDEIKNKNNINFTYLAGNLFLETHFR